MTDSDIKDGPGPSAAPPGEAARQPYHHGELRPALIRSARALLEEEGLEALSLRAVARRAGVSRQAPYHHFADKHALLAAVATEGFRELAATSLARMQQAPDARARLNASGVAYVVFAAANPSLFQLMFGGLGGRFNQDEALNAARKDAFAVIRAASADVPAVSRGTPDLSAVAAWAFVHGLAELLNKGAIQPRDFGLADAEALADQLIR